MMSAGQLMVLEIELSTWRCSAACISRCARGVSSSAVTKAGVSGALAPNRLAIEGVRVVLDRLGARRAVALEHAALVAEVEHRLDAAGDVAGQQRDGAGGRDRGDEAVAHAVAGDGAAHLLGQALHVGGGQEALGVVEREGALLARQLGAGEIGGLLDRRHPALRQRHRLGRAVAHAAQDQRVGEPGDAEADAALGLGLLALGASG